MVAASEEGMLLAVAVMGKGPTAVLEDLAPQKPLLDQQFQVVILKRLAGRQNLSHAAPPKDP